MPKISADGKTVTVRIKKGVRFGPPVNREVTSADVKYAIERSFSVSVTNGYVNLYFWDLVGAPAKPPKTPKPVSGIKTPNKYTLVFKLKAPRATLGERARHDEHGSDPEGVRREVRQQDDVRLRLLPGRHRAVHVRGERRREHQGRGLHARAARSSSCATRTGRARPTSGRRTWTRSRSRRGSRTPRSASARSSTGLRTVPATTRSSRGRPEAAPDEREVRRQPLLLAQRHRLPHAEHAEEAVRQPQRPASGELRDGQERHPPRRAAGR